MTLAAVSSSGVRTTAGKRAACAGRVTVKASAVNGARANTTAAGACSTMTVATASMATTWSA